MMQAVALYNPETAPFKGWNSYLDAAGLPQGTFRKVKNLLYENNVLKARAGSNTFGTPIAGATFRGAAFFVINGRARGYVAWDDGSKVNLYEINPDSGVQTLLTAASSIYGQDTRMTTGKDVTFAAYTMPYSDDTATGQILHSNQVVAVNGTDRPRIILADNDPTVVANPVALAGDVSLSSLGLEGETNSSVKWSWHQYFKVSHATAPVFTAGGTGSVTGANSGVVPDDFYVITFTNPVLADSVVIDFGAAATLYSHPNGTNDGLILYGGANTFDAVALNIVYDVNRGNFLENIAIDLGTPAAAYTEVFNGQDSKYAIVDVALQTGGIHSSKRVVAIPLTHLAANFEARYIRIRWTAPTLAATTITWNLYCIAASGTVEGERDFAYTMRGPFMVTETAPQVITRHSFEYLKNIGGTRLSDVRIPNNAALHYVPVVTLRNPNAGSALASEYELYSRKLGETRMSRYYTLHCIDIATGTPISGSLRGTFSVGLSRGNLGTHLPKQFTALTNDMPSGGHIGISQKAAFVISSAERVFFAEGAAVYISGHKQPLRFRHTVEVIDGQPNLESPTVVKFPGETVRAIVDASTAMVGVTTIYVFTDKGVYSIEGYDSVQMSYPKRLGEFGITAKRTALEYKGTVMWLDSDFQLWAMGPSGSQPLSLGKVEDQFRDSPLPKNAASCYFKDKILIAVTKPLDTENKRILVWSARVGDFTGYLEYPSDYSFADLLTITKSDGKQRLIAFSATNNGTIYELETGTLDNTTKISIELETGELHSQMWDEFSVERIGVVCDSESGGTLATLRTFKPTETFAYPGGSLDIAQAGTTSYVYDTANNGNAIPGGRGVSCVINITGTVTGGWALRSLVMEADRSDIGAAA